jgi:hypothetical protein
MKQDDDVIDSQRSRRKKYTRRSFLINRSFGNSLLCILGLRDFQTLNNKNLASFPRSRKLKNGDRHTRDAPYLYYTLSLNARKVLVSSSFRERERERRSVLRAKKKKKKKKRSFDLFFNNDNNNNIFFFV